MQRHALTARWSRSGDRSPRRDGASQVSCWRRRPLLRQGEHLFLRGLPASLGRNDQQLQRVGPALLHERARGREHGEPRRRFRIAGVGGFDQETGRRRAAGGARDPRSAAAWRGRSLPRMSPSLHPPSERIDGFCFEVRHVRRSIATCHTSVFLAQHFSRIEKATAFPGNQKHCGTRSSRVKAP